MPTLTVDNREVSVPQGATVLEAARAVGLDIPTLCFREGCRPESSCLVCVVRINGAARLMPSCATPAAEGMVVESETPEIHGARRTALELLLGDHLGDCVGPCEVTCPAHLDIPGMIRLISEGRMAEAAEKVRERIPLPAILGRICPTMCEKACRRGELDQPISILLLKRYVGDWALRSGARSAVMPDTGRRVAVVGAGPAGLCAAYYLRRAGHACVLFDDHPEPGGGLRYGVPPQRLPRGVLDAELASITDLGVELRPGTRVGRDISLEELRRSFDAVVLATGAVSEADAQALGLAVRGEALQADRETHQASLPGVFVAGSALAPSQHAVRAVGSGRSAATSVMQYLAHEEATGAHRPFTTRMGPLDAAEMSAFAARAPRYGRLQPGGASDPEPAEAPGFAPEEACAEADRCLHCECAALSCCRLRELAIRLDARPARYRDRRRVFTRETSHPELVHEPGKCISCGLCVQIAEREREPLGLSFVGRGFTVRVGVPFNEELAAALALAARACAEACPTGALVLRSPSPDRPPGPSPQAGPTDSEVT